MAGKTKPTQRAPEALPESPLNKAAAELIRMAEEGGVEQNFFFTTTFNRYKVLLNTLTKLQKEIEKGELLVEKVYKNRTETAANPAIAEFCKVSTAANQTVQTLIKIINTFAEGPVMNGASSDSDEIDL